jgi:hypothetical protein
MDVIAAFLARVLRMCLSRPCTDFLPIGQAVRAPYKTRNQFRLNWLQACKRSVIADNGK